MWIEGTPAGDVVVVYMEADNLASALQGTATSDEPFDVWFREHVRDVHGVELEGFPPPEQILDFHQPPASSRHPA